MALRREDAEELGTEVTGQFGTVGETLRGFLRLDPVPHDTVEVEVVLVQPVCDRIGPGRLDLFEPDFDPVVATGADVGKAVFQCHSVVHDSRVSNSHGHRLPGGTNIGSAARSGEH
jgi:hypothetical protein